MPHKIPERWKVFLLGDISDLSAGGTPSTKILSFWKNGTIRWMNSGEIHLKRIFEVGGRITEEAYKKSSAKLLPKGTILIALAGQGKTRGTVAITEVELTTNQSVGAIQLDRNVAQPLFIFYNLDSRYQELRRISLGDGRSGLNLNILSSLRLYLPPLCEQNKIVQILSAWDNAIEMIKRLVDAKIRLKKCLMQKILTGKKRLPEFKGKWETKKLGELGDCLIGLTYKPSDVKKEGLLVLRSSNILDGRLKFDDTVYVKMDVPERLIVRKDDILICVRNGSKRLIGKCAIINEKIAGMTFGAFMAVFRTPYARFVFYQFQSDNIKKQIQEHLGATINQITNKSLNSFRIPFPKDKAEQVAIAQIFTTLDKELDLLKKKLDLLSLQKESLVHKLLTGKIRVKV